MQNIDKLLSDIFIDGISNLLSENTDNGNIINKYGEKFRENSVLDLPTFIKIVKILKKVAKDNGLSLDHSKLKVRFNPAGFTIKNIFLKVVDLDKKEELIRNLAKNTGDENIKHKFDENQKVNLYLAINKQFADKVRQLLNLEVSHQVVDTDSGMELPMATFTQPTVTASKPKISEEFNIKIISKYIVD